jgi:hypothetical protein
MRLFTTKPRRNSQSHAKRYTSRLLAASLSVGLLAYAGGPAFAHHSTAVYEFSTTTIEGMVLEFRYINPHSILVLRQSGATGRARIWRLEGYPPGALVREGFSRNSLRPGDRIILQIQRLRSGKAGGYWKPRTVIILNRH